MKCTKTTVYLLSDGKTDSTSLIIDALDEYLVKHPERLKECRGLTNQILYCKDNFSVPYEASWRKEK